MDITVTLIITILTAAVSIWGFSSTKVIDDLIFFGPAISKNRQYYRFITHGLIHADVMHLAFNMIAFYSFGQFLEAYFSSDILFDSYGKLYFVGLYVGGLIIASIPDYFKHKDDYYFRSLGASGAVSSVIFACIMLEPKMPLNFIFLPGVPIPGWLFGGAYLAISAYLDRQGGGRINHGAHLWGAIFGIVFIIVFASLQGHINVFENFVRELRR